MAVLIDAADEHLIRTSPPTRAAFSACGWARTTSSGSYRNLICTEAADLEAVHLIGFKGADLYLYSRGSAEVLFSSSPTEGAWFFWYISASADGQDGGWAVPGSAFVTAYQSPIYASATDHMTAGDDAYNEPLIGNLAHVKVWTATVPPAELQQEMYRGTPKRLTDLHLWSPLLVNSNDYSGNGRDWTEGGTLTWEGDPPVPLIVTDDFNRADSSDLGPNWLEVQGNSVIANQRIAWSAGTTNTKAKWVGASVGSPDQYCQANRWGSGWQAVYVRCTGTVPGDFFAYAVWVSGSQSRVGWAYGTDFGAYLDSGNTPIPSYVDGQTIRLEVEGQDDDIVLRFYFDDVLYKTLTKAQFTDQDAVLNSGEPGLFFYGGGQWDNFKAGPLGDIVWLHTGHPAIAIADWENQYTFNSVDIGDAAADRIVVVGCYSSAAVVSSLTIGGISATIRKEFAASTPHTSLWTAPVPTGTTADVVVNSNGTMYELGIMVGRLTGAMETPVATGGASDSDEEPFAVDVNISSGNHAVIFAACADRATLAATTWTNATKDYEIQGSNKQMIAAYSPNVGAPTSVSFTASGLMNYRGVQMVAVAFEPSIAHGLAWGEQNPDETASSWQTWETAPGTPINVSGDEDWGAAMVASGTPCYGPVVDTGNAYSKTFTVEHDVYAQGGGDVAIYIRGSATTFGQHDGSPSWTEYTAPVTEHWRYVQLKMEQG